MNNRHPGTPRPGILRLVLVSTGFLAFFLMASYLGSFLRAEPWLSSWYLPTGIIFALIILGGMGYVPAVFIAVIAAMMLVYHLPLTLSLILLGLLISAGYAVAALLIRRLFGPHPALSTLSEMGSLILVGIFTPFVLAGSAVSLLSQSVSVTGQIYVGSAFQLWVSDTLGNLVIVPLLITLFMPTEKSYPVSRAGWQERLRAIVPDLLLALMQAACILVTLWIVFGLNTRDDKRLWYLFFLPLIWVILQFGLRGGAVAILSITIGSLVAVRYFNYSLAVYEDLQIFMLMLALSGLVIGAAFQELRRAQKRLHSRLEMEGRITSISTRFINLSIDQVDDEIRQAMQSIGAYCGADGSHLMLFAAERGPRRISRALGWSAHAGASEPETIDHLNLATDLPYLWSQLMAGVPFYAPSVSALPKEAAAERKYMEQHHLRSMVTIPILLGNRLAGSLGFHSSRNNQIWAEEDIRLLSLLGETFMNVLERQRAENLMRESDRKFRSVVLQSYDGIILVNERGQVIEWNNGMERITGLERLQVLGRMIWDVQFELTPLENRTPELAQTFKKISQSYQTGTLESWINQLTEVVLARPDGQRRFIQTMNFPIQTARGHMTGTIARDVTEVRQGEAELRRSQARLAEAERMAHLGHFQISVPDGQMEWSAETYRICNWNIDTPVPNLKTVLDNIHPDDRGALLEAFDRALLEKAPFDLEYRILISPTEVKYIHTIGQVLTDHSGRVTHVFGTMMDTTENILVVAALRESESRYRELADSISDVFFALDPNMVVTYWNPASAALTSIPAERAVGQAFFALLPNLRGSSVEQFAQEAVRTRNRQGFVMEYRVRSKKVYLDVNAYPFTNGLAIFIRDVTERQIAEERLRQSEARYRAVVEDQTDLICRFTPSGVLTFANEAYCRCYGRARRELVGQFFVCYSSASNRRDLSGQYTSLRRGRAVTYDYQTMLPDGKMHWLQWTDRPIFNDEGKIVEYQSVGRDISESKRLEEELRYLSTHDALTGIYNRSFFEAELARLQRGRNWPVSILMVDVNGLKSTNDTRGHPAGDELLKRAAHVLSACFRPEDIVARFGGDEFAVLLPGTDEYAADEVMRRVRDFLETYNRASGAAPLSLSLGIATGERGQSLLETLTRADTKMYQDKLRQKRTGELRLN